jgi:hypothetical protein
VDGVHVSCPHCDNNDNEHDDGDEYDIGDERDDSDDDHDYDYDDYDEVRSSVVYMYLPICKNEERINTNRSSV